MATTHAKSVLIVDDNAFIRQALCELFERESDFEVCGEAENGKEAIEKAQQLHPDLIVLDLSMPVLNGFDAARVLKRLLPAAFPGDLCGFDYRALTIKRFGGRAGCNKEFGLCTRLSPTNGDFAPPS